MSELTLDDVGIPLDASEPFDVADPSPFDIDQTAGEAFPDHEAAFADLQNVHGTDIASFDESGLTTTDQVSGYIEGNIPAEHLSGLDSIEYVDDQSAYEQGLMGMWEYDYWTNTVSIEVYPHDDVGTLYDTVAHEIGHNAEEGIPPDLVSEWNALHDQSWTDLLESGFEQDSFITGYAETSPEEDFAETYSFYINDPLLVQAICPDKYDFMKDHVFGGREF